MKVEIHRSLVYRPITRRSTHFFWPPIASAARVYGWLGLRNKLGAEEFSADEERIATSLAAQDIIQTYDLRATAYVVKPVDLEQLVSIVKKIEQFWFTIVILPPE